MKAFNFFTWLFMGMGLMGLVFYLLTPSYEEPNSAIPLCLLAMGMAGLGFKAYLDKKG